MSTLPPLPGPDYILLGAEHVGQAKTQFVDLHYLEYSREPKDGTWQRSVATGTLWPAYNYCCKGKAADGIPPEDRQEFGPQGYVRRAPILSLTVVGSICSDIREASIEMVRLANLLGVTVRMDFNGTELFAQPGDSAYRVSEPYMHALGEMHKRRERPESATTPIVLKRRSPEGEARYWVEKLVNEPTDVVRLAAKMWLEQKDKPEPTGHDCAQCGKEEPCDDCPKMKEGA